MDNNTLKWLDWQESTLRASLSDYLNKFETFREPDFDQENVDRARAVIDFLRDSIKDELKERCGKNDCACRGEDDDEVVGILCNHCNHYVYCHGEEGTDADFDTYAVQVQNGEGYYDESGNYHSYHIDED